MRFELVASGSAGMDHRKPGPAQRLDYEPRQVRKEAAVVFDACAAGSLVFYAPGVGLEDREA